MSLPLGFRASFSYSRPKGRLHPCHSELKHKSAITVRERRYHHHEVKDTRDCKRSWGANNHFKPSGLDLQTTSRSTQLVKLMFKVFLAPRGSDKTSRSTQLVKLMDGKTYVSGRFSSGVQLLANHHDQAQNMANDFRRHTYIAMRLW